MKNRTTMTRTFVASMLALAIGSCSGDKDPPAMRPAPVVPTMTPQTIDAGVAAAEATQKSAKDGTKGDQQDSEWVPAEFKTGTSRWKDTGVYVDGRPVGFMTWGELPVALKPVWLRDKVSANKRANTNDPGWRWMQQRFYRFTDYLKALGIDVHKVKAMHVYGPKMTNSIIITGKDLQSPLAKNFLFQFGGSTYGKAVPRVPERFAAGSPPDKIASVMIYIEKTPPTLVPDVGFMLGDAVQMGVPYYGDPIRGGVRIYLDDHYAAIVKRQELDPKQASKGADGEPSWSLAALLTAQGVNTSKVVEMWAIQNERRVEKISGSELEKVTFQASSQAKGGVLLDLGERKVRANALALHTRALKQEELPYITPDDE
ncbi:MAG TPA: hypothetical protein VN253_06405 [Kofleriaceae bacterium]|nr:hypothetical protein [Kofleriaceae bacterium]